MTDAKNISESQTDFAATVDKTLSRRALLKSSAMVAGLVGAGPFMRQAMAADKAIDLYAGSWVTKGGEKGFYRYKFNTATGNLSLPESIADNFNVGGLMVDADRNLVQLMDSSDKQPGFRYGGGGAIATYKIDPPTGELEKIGSQLAYGSAPAMVTYDPSGKYAVVPIHATPMPVTRAVEVAPNKYEVVAQYPTSSVNLLPLNEDGTLGEAVDVHETYGSGPGPTQGSSHPHCAVWDPKGRFFICCDKGADRIYSMAIDYRAERIVHTAPPFATEPGAVPRYARFHPDKNILYVNFENANKLGVFRYDEHGALSLIRYEPVVSEALEAKMPEGAGVIQQDLRLHPSGDFLFTVVRGSRHFMDGAKRGYEKGFDGVTTFKVDSEGMLEYAGTVELEGNWPRGCILSPDGRFLLVACLYSDEIISLEIGRDGALKQVSSFPQNAVSSLAFYDGEAGHGTVM